MASIDASLISQAFYELAEDFPSKANPQRQQRYIDRLTAKGFAAVDIAEGLTRIIHVHDAPTFPSFAKVLRYCSEAANDRRVAERANTAQVSERCTYAGPEEIERCRKIRALGKLGVFYCDTCREFKQAERGFNGTGWDPCHYAENLNLWAKEEDQPIVPGSVDSAWAEFESGAEPEIVQPGPAAAVGFSSVGDELGGVF